MLMRTTSQARVPERIGGRRPARPGSSGRECDGGPGPNPLGLPIGSQVYPLRSMLKDFPAFAKTMAEIGVTRLELCSPIGYGQRLRVARGRERGQEDPGRSRHEGRELPLQHGRAAATARRRASSGRRRSASRR